MTEEAWDGNARETLELIERQRRQAQHSYVTSPVPFCVCWGLTYLLGVGAVFLAHPESLHLFPMPVALAVLGVLIVAAIVFSAVYGARSGQGIRGRSRTTGAMYGVSWPAAFAALSMVNGTIGDRFGFSTDQQVLLWTGTSLVLIGGMSMVGGALWREPAMYAAGVFVLISAALSVLVGVPGNFLVLALGVGGGFLVLAAYLRFSGRFSGTAGRAA